VLGNGTVLRREAHRSPSRGELLAGAPQTTTPEGQELSHDGELAEASCPSIGA
jgi:hypothetical protein